MATTKHGYCGKEWTQRANSTSHCPACHETFATLTLFDMHGRGEWAGRYCADPRTDKFGLEKRPVHLVPDNEGVWWTAEGLADLAVRSDRAREAFLTGKGGLTRPDPHNPTPDGLEAAE